MNEIKPRLQPKAYFKTDGDTESLCMRDDRVDLNRWSKEIVELFDGKNDIDQISFELHRRYPRSTVREIQKKVCQCTRDLWSRGVFLDFRSSRNLAIDIYGDSGYAYIPGFCHLPKMEPNYLNPSFQKEQFEDSRTVALALGDAGCVIVHYDDLGGIDGAVAFGSTSCSQTYYLIASYGEAISLENSLSIRNQISNHYERLNCKELQTQEPIWILKHYRKIPDGLPKCEVLSHVLKWEFNDGHLIITRMEL